MTESKLLTRISEEMKMEGGGGEGSRAEGRVDHAEGRCVGSRE